MAYVSCAAQLAADIAQNCDTPLVGGYTGLGVLIPADNVEFVTDGTNPRKIKSITKYDDVFIVDNVNATPFTGSSTAGNSDSGYPAYLKTIAVRVPMRGADSSKNVVEALFNSPSGFVGVFAKKDKVGDGSFEVIGAQSAMVGDISSLTRDESANGGAWSLNLTCTESWAEVTLVGDNDTYSSAKQAWDGLIAAARARS